MNNISKQKKHLTVFVAVALLFVSALAVSMVVTDDDDNESSAANTMTVSCVNGTVTVSLPSSFAGKNVSYSLSVNSVVIYPAGNADVSSSGVFYIGCSAVTGDTISVTVVYDSLVYTATAIATDPPTPPVTYYTVTGVADPTIGGSVTGGGSKASGSSVTLTAVANAGYKFVSWNDGTTTATKTFIVTSNVTYTATFVKAQYTITFDSAGGSAVSSITADYGTSVTAPADPTREGYTFTGWSPVVPTTMPASNITCVAQWEINTYTVTLVAGTGGTVLGQGTYDYGTSVRILATPGSGYVFTSWSDGGAMTHDITITGDVTLTATFKAVQGTTYTITVDSGTNGSIVGNTTIESGTSAIFYILADTDYIVTNVTIDGISVGTMGSYTFSNVTANHSISATFDYSNGATTEVDKEGNVTENIVTVIGTITETVSRTTLVDGSTDMLVNIVDTSNGVETTAFNNGTETSVITTITVDSTSESGVSVSFVDDFVMDAALAQAATAAAAAGIEDPNPVVEISVISGSRTDERCVVEMSLDSMKSIDDASAEVEIVSDNGTMTLDSDVVSTLAAGEGDTVSLTIGFASKDDLNEKQREAVGDNTIIELSATVGTTAVYDLGGTVTITIPYILKAGEDPANIQIWYLDDNGNIETFSAVYDSVTETVSFTTTHFSYYAIAFTTDSESISIWIYVAVIVIVLILVCIVGYYFGVVKKRAI